MITYRTEKTFEEKELKDLFLSVNWLSANYADRLVKALQNSAAVISAWDGEKLVGLINAIDDGELTAYAHYLLVNPKFQRLGIGKELIDRLKKKYEGYLYLVLIAENKEVMHFYKKMGFVAEENATPMVIQTL